MDYRHKPPHRGVNFGRRSGVNIQRRLTTYRTIRDKHVPRYLAEFEYRFNRRYDLAAMMPRLGYVAVRTPPMPYRLLKLAENHA